MEVNMLPYSYFKWLFSTVTSFTFDSIHQGEQLNCTFGPEVPSNEIICMDLANYNPLYL